MKILSLMALITPHKDGKAGPMQIAFGNGPAVADAQLPLKWDPPVCS